MMMFFYAISQLNISVVVAISFTAPLFTAILAVYFFKDKPNIHQIFALLVGFFGVYVVVSPDSKDFDPMCLLVLVSTMFWGVSGILIKKLSQTDGAMQTTFYMTFFMMLMVAPLALYEWKNPTMDEYLWLFGVAVSSNLLQYSLAKSLGYADFSVVLPFDFTRLIFSSGIAYIFFHETMEPNTVIGSVVILSAAFYAALNERKKIRRLAAMARAGTEV
jgi:drug/metabolite transporter (DMT)-like permease